MAPPSDLFKEWLEANRAAYAAEIDALRRAIRAEAGNPSPDLLEATKKARELRQKADARYQPAMADMARLEKLMKPPKES